MTIFRKIQEKKIILEISFLIDINHSDIRKMLLYSEQVLISYITVKFSKNKTFLELVTLFINQLIVDSRHHQID